LCGSKNSHEAVVDSYQRSTQLLTDRAANNQRTTTGTCRRVGRLVRLFACLFNTLH